MEICERYISINSFKGVRLMNARAAKRRRLPYIIITVLLIFIVIGIAAFFYIANQASDDFQRLGEQPPADEEHIIAVTPTPTPTPTPVPTPTPIPYTDAVWIGVGDIMSHMPQLPGAYNKEEDSYNFEPYFEPIQNLLVDGDWVMANLETPIAGKDIGYSGYPTFNAPNELADALWNSGFNILSTANNHSLDKGEKGILRTLETVQDLGFITAGTAASEEEAERPVIVEHNDIAMGILSYTYGTNGIPIPQGKDYLVNLIDKEKIIEDMKKLREAGADVITIALHFGNEYQTQPTEEQKTLARELIAAGATIIAGSHPHVLQPYEVVDTIDVNGNETQGLIIYSMGNFISNQRGESKDYGGIFRVDIRKHHSTGKIELTNIEVTPTWVHRYKPDQHYRYEILPVAETIEQQNNERLKAADYAMLQKDLEMLNKRLESMK